MKKILVFFLLVCFGLHATSQLASSLARFMQYCQANFRFNGVVLVADSNQNLYKQAFGKANIKTNVNNQLTTKFRLGSLSKQFTAFITLQLIEKKQLSFKDCLTKYI